MFFCIQDKIFIEKMNILKFYNFYAVALYALWHTGFL